MGKSLTQGCLTGEFADRTPTKPDGDVVAAKFSSQVDPPLKSAYVVANGKEPDFTNFAYTKPMGDAMDAFLEPGWAVTGVLPTVASSAIDRSKPYPTASQPS